MLQLIPLDVLCLIFDYLTGGDVINCMVTSIKLWSSMRYNFPFWRKHHVKWMGEDFLLTRLGDPFISVRTRLFSRFALAERVVATIGNKGEVYGGYVRDRLAGRFDFRDINIAVSTSIMAESVIDSLVAKFRVCHVNDPTTSDVHTMIKYAGEYSNYVFRVKESDPNISLTITFTITHDLVGHSQALDFDINSLCIHKGKILLIYPGNQDELQRVKRACRERKFRIVSPKITDPVSLVARIDYMKSLGFTYDPATVHLPSRGV